MKMEVQIISEENVKPSSPTPSHLSILKLSLLDQFMPSPYAPIILFYPMNKDATHLDVRTRLNLLKTSLSETLTCFYPLAGKIKDDLSIDCDDEGAYFVETGVDCSLDEFLTKPDLLSINRFLPCEFMSKESTVGTRVTNVQANIFDCGGIAIGICISHRILDGAALSNFLQGWAANARGCRIAIHPNFVASSLFPADDLWLRESCNTMWGSLLRKGNCITKRFVFYASAISELKAEATSSGIKCPTRVEVVSAFLWRSTMAASADLRGFQRPSMLTHLVNLRRRMEKSENFLGNLLWVAAAEYIYGRDKCSDLKFGDLVGKVKDSISRIDDEFVKQMKGEEGKSVMLKSLKAVGEIGSKDEVDCYGFSSWCNFRYYDSDFGWGKPVWVSSIGLEGSVFMNLIILVDTKFGESVEAWVTLDEQDMAKLESNPDIIRLASLDPSPLITHNYNHCSMLDQI